METEVAIATKVLEQRQYSFVEANVTNNSAKFQLYPRQSFCGVEFFNMFSANFDCWLQLRDFNKKVRLVQDHSRIIYVKVLSKYLQ